MTTDNRTKTIILAGATGAIGSLILELASTHEQIGHVIALTRRPIEPLPKVSNEIVDFDRLPKDAPWWKADAVICALGTTRKQAGSDEAFERVDFHMPANLALMAHTHQIPCFVLNSSMMANPDAKGLYLRTKGRAEQSVIKAGFDSVVIARPGLLDAQREESRPAEYMGILASRLFNPILPKKYRSVPAKNLAKRMLDEAIRSPAGVHYLESDQFQA